MSPPKHPYTIQEVADMYGYTYERIRREISEGRLHAAHKRGQSKRWYITDADLKEWTETMLAE